jgi:hypothetical protein
MGALNSRDSSGSMGSQMRCTAMLENVAKDNRKIARRVAGDSSWEGEIGFDFKAEPLYYGLAFSHVTGVHGLVI